MSGTRGGRLAVRPAIILTGVLLAVSGLVVLTLGAAPVLPSLQDTSPAYVSLDPDRLDFEKQVVGRQSRARRITVTNTGGQTLSVDSVAVGGDDARNFFIVKDTCTGAQVVAYRACFVDVSFAPSGTDSFEAELKMLDSAPTSPRTLRLEGDGVNSSMVPPFDED